MAKWFEAHDNQEVSFSSAVIIQVAQVIRVMCVSTAYRLDRILWLSREIEVILKCQS